MATLHNVGQANFHKFVFEAGQAVSNAASEFTVPPNVHYRRLGVQVDVWTAADIGLEVLLQNDGINWLRLDYQGAPIRCRTVLAGRLLLVDEALAFAEGLPIKKLRLISINSGTFAAVNQVAGGTVRAYFY